jgi:hypothetical protein
MAWNTYSVPNSGSQSINDLICVGADKFVGCGSQGYIITSVDAGHTWVQRTTPAGAVDWFGLATDGTVVVMVGNNKIARSLDFGATWSIATTLATGQAQTLSVTYAAFLGMFVSVGYNGVSSTSHIITSSDQGVTWNTRTHPLSLGFSGVAASGSRIVAFSPYQTSTPGDGVVTSLNGSVWSAGAAITDFSQIVAQGSNYFVYSSAAGKFVAGGYQQLGTPQAKLLLTTDASSWASETSAPLTNYSIFGAFFAANGIGGFLSSFPYGQPFFATPTPTIIGTSEDGGATWVDEDTTFSPGAFWQCGAFDETNRTAVFWDGGGSNTVLVGSFPAADPTLTSVSPSSGPTTGGTAVTVTGTNIPAEGGFSLLIGGVAPTSVVRVSDTTITCVTGIHAAGAVDAVLYYEGGGSSVTLDDAFTYVGNLSGPTQLGGMRRSPMVKVSSQLGGSAKLDFSKPGVVSVGESYYVIDPTNGRRVHTGPVLRSAVTFDADARESTISNCSAQDNLWFFNKRLPYCHFTDTDVDVVVKHLVQKFAPDFSTNGVASGLGQVSVQYGRNKRLSDLISELAGLVGAHFRLDSETNDVFFGIDESIDTPDDVTDDEDSLLLLDPPITLETDLSQVRTRVYVYGHNAGADANFGSEVTPPTLEADWQPVISGAAIPTEGDGDIPVDPGGYYAHYQLGALTEDGVAFTINGAAGGIWVYQFDSRFPPFIAYTNISLTFQRVLYHKDARVTKLVLYRMVRDGNPSEAKYFRKVAEVDNNPVAALLFDGSQFVSLKDTLSEADLLAAEQAPSTNETLIVGGMWEDTDAQAALAALEGGDGVHEFAVFDASIMDIPTAQLRAEAELAMFKSALLTLTYGTRDPKSVQGAMVHVDLTWPPITGDFKIQSVTIDQIHENDDTGARYVVTASSQLFTLSDLFHRIIDVTLSGGGGSVSGGGAGATGGPSGWAASAAKLTTARRINGVLFDGTEDIDVGAAPNYLAETPSGAVNGVNMVFTTAHAYRTGQLFIYVNGLRTAPGNDFTETTSTSFTFVTAPHTGDVVLVDYVSY